MQTQQQPSIEECFGFAAGLRSPWRPIRCLVNDASKTVHLWVSNQRDPSTQQRRRWFGPKTVQFASRLANGPDQQWRHLDCMSYACVIHTSDSLQPGDHDLDWFGPPNIAFTRRLAKKVFLLLMEGVDMQVICDTLHIPFAELWKFKYELDNGLLHFEYTPSARRKAKLHLDSLPPMATRPAALDAHRVEASSDVPDISDPIWEQLITGGRSIEIKTLSLQLLLTKLRQQVSHMQSADVKIMKLRELHRYVERNQRVLRHELEQLKWH